MKKTSIGFVIFICLFFLFPLSGFSEEEKIRFEAGGGAGIVLSQYQFSNMGKDGQFGSEKLELKPKSVYLIDLNLGYYFSDPVSFHSTLSIYAKNFRITRSSADYDSGFTFLGLGIGARSRFLKVFYAGIGGFIGFPVSFPEITGKKFPNENYQKEIGLYLEGGISFPLTEEWSFFGGVELKIAFTRMYQNKMIDQMNTVDSVNDSTLEFLNSQALLLKAGMNYRFEI